VVNELPEVEKDLPTTQIGRAFYSGKSPQKPVLSAGTLSAKTILTINLRTNRSVP